MKSGEGESKEARTEEGRRKHGLTTVVSSSLHREESMSPERSAIPKATKANSPEDNGTMER